MKRLLRYCLTGSTRKVLPYPKKASFGLLISVFLMLGACGEQLSEEQITKHTNYQLELTPSAIELRPNTSESKSSLTLKNSTNSFDPQSSALQREVYEKTDLKIYQQDNGDFAYDFILASGADVSAIQIEIADHASIAANGDLHLPVENGLFVHSAPVSYQEIDGQRIEVESAFTLADATLGFELGDYDPNYELVIDPTISFVMAVTVNVFEDLDNDGVDDGAGESGVAGATLTAFNDAGTATILTDNGDGSYTLTASGGPFRIEVTDLPAGLEPGAAGATTTFFLADGESADVALIDPSRFCQSNPRATTTCYDGGTASGKTTPALISSTYSNILNTLSAGKRTDAQTQEIGTAWGIAFKRTNQRLFTSSVVRRHAGEGPRGFDGVYVFDYTNTSVPLLGGFDLEGITPANSGDAISGGVNISLGSVTRVTSPASADNFLSSSTTVPTRDLDAFDKVGRVGYGDIDLSEDENTLWLVNLNQRALISVDISNYTPSTTNPIAPTGEVNQYLIDEITGLPNCQGGIAYPWGLKFFKGKGYLGVICNGENAQNNINRLIGYVLSFDPNDVAAGFTTEVTIPMNYTREGWGSNQPSNSSGWRPWVRNWAQTGLPTTGLGGFSQVAWPQPIVSDIEFADNGDMIIGIIDRFAMQTGNMQTLPVSGNNILTTGLSNGDILQACQSGSGFILEDGGTTCGQPDIRSNTNVGASSGTLRTDDGPGNNGEYYFDDFQQNNEFTTHKENALGALAVLRGEEQVLATVFNPVNGTTFENGYHVYNTDTGVEEANYSVFANGPNTGTFGKQAGLGDIEFICDPATIQVGNYVWNDTDGDGIQDPSENGIAGVTIELFADTNGDGTPNRKVAETTTDANGQYLFSEAGTNVYGENEDWSFFNGDDNEIEFNTAYEIRIPLAQGVLGGLPTTTQDANGIMDNNNLTDLSDSDATTIGGNAVIEFRTGSPGENNHTLDAGFGEQVCNTILLATLTCEDDAINSTTISDYIRSCTAGMPSVAAFFTNRAFEDIIPQAGSCSFEDQSRWSIVSGSTATFEEFSNGTALIKLLVESVCDANKQIEIVITLSGRTFSTPAGSPNFGANTTCTGATVDNGGSVDVSDWYYYTGIKGLMLGKMDLAGLEIALDRNGPSLQVGTGGNQFNENGLGLATWFTPTILSQPSTGPAVKDATLYDINVDIDENILEEEPFTTCFEICSENDEVTITATPQTGQAPFTFEWSTGAMTTSITVSTADDYTVTITDANGCEEILTTTVSTVDCDYGDLPSPYATLRADDGPVHKIIPGRTLKLGATVDGEADGQPSADAGIAGTTGDDGDGTDDEDGVTFPTFIPGQMATVTVSLMNMTGQNANLLGFIDWNNDGAFDGTGEVADIVIVADQATAANIIFDVPNDAVLDENLGARFRITTDDLSLLPEASEGAADDGEVEDYLILLSEPVDPSVCPTDLDNLIADRTVTTSTNITLGNNEVVFVQGDVTIPTLGGNATGTLVIESGVVTVQNINVSGLTILVESGATFIKPSSFVVTGRVLNKGLIESGEIVVNGILENCACIQADGAFSINSGGAFNNFIGAELQIAPGQNFTASSGSTANNFSLINVTGGNLNIDSGADVTNSEGGFFNVSDNVTVNGNLVNESTAIVIVGNHFIVNNTATNNGEIYVEGDVFNVSGSVDGTGTVFFADGSGPAVTGSYNNTDAPFTTSPAVPVSACGELPLGTIGNFVYIDEDSDGFQDEGEVGIPNVAVVLKDGNGNPLDTTYTDSDGKYLFTDLPTGNYFVDVLDGEDGTANTLPNAALSQTTIITNEVDSPTDVDTVLDDGDLGNKPHVGNGYAITLDPGEENLTADFGYNYNPSIDVNDPPNGNDPTAALGDRVWIDSDGDGVQDPNEIGVSGVQITLTGAGADGIFGTGDDVIATTTTDENGFYLFDNLTPGAYRTEVTSSDPAVTGVPVSHDVLDDTNYTQTGDPDEFAELATMPDNKQTKSTVLGPGDVFLNSDYGYQPTPANMILGSIGNTIWLDADADANGPEDNDPLSDGDNGAGTENDNEEAPIASVSVSLIQDTNGDGVWDPDGADNMLGTADDEPIVATDVTDENGQYLFEDLPLNNAGDGDDTDSDYIVWVNDTDNVLDGLQNTFDEDGGAGTDATGAGDDASAVGGLSAVTLDNTNRDDRDQDFGYTGEAQTPNDGNDTNDGFIGDFVWFDTDGDDATPDMGNVGQNQAAAEGDAGIEGVMVELNTAIEVIDGRIDVNDDGVVNGDDDGVIDGISIINGRPDLNGDGNTGGLDNGFILGVEVISGRVDIDENGSTSAADRPDDDGFLLESVAMAKTDENGFYFFGGLPVDDDGVDYRVRILDSNFAPGGVLENLESTFEPDGNNDNLGEVVTLTTAMPGDLDQDFGYTGDDAGTLGSIGSTIWEDTDNNGVYEPDGRDGLANTDDDEMPLAGITVDLYRDLDGNGQLDPGEPLIGQATTDAMGNYLFDNLPMGDYIVDVSDEAGLLNGFFSSPVPTTDANTNITGTGDAETADDAMGTVGGDRSKPDAFAVTLDDNNGTPDVVNNLNVDFGYYKEAAALGNYVWLDTNGNGLQDDGETGINGVQVSLEIEYPDGTTVIVVTETVNDANDNPGFYEFPNLLLDEDYNSGAGTGVNGEDPNSVDPTGTQTPKYVIAVDPNQTVFTNQDLSPTLTDVAAATMDKDDADAFTGVVAIPIQGSEDTAAKDPEIDENPIASYDFGVANQLDLATIVEVTSPTPPQGFYDEDDPVTFTSTTTNQGDVAISDLTIINYLPNELENHELVLNSLMINGSMPPAGVTITKNGDDYIIDFGNDPNNWLQPGDVVSFEIISDISPFAVPSTMIINTTEISAYDTDNDPNTPVLDDVDSVADNTNGNGPGETIGADLVDNETGEDGRNGGDEDDHDIAELPMDLVLPVEWLGFSVKAAKEHIDLTWATASEINNSHFELERSEDGKSFKQIARVKGQGNTLTRTDYSYEDKTAISGVLYYYRVKNVDFDESFSYSEIRSARLAAEKADMEVYPNPVGQNQTLNVRIFLEDLSTAIYLMDIDGNRVRVLRENVLAKGWNTIALSVADLAAGTYFVTDQNGNSKQFIKIE